MKKESTMSVSDLIDMITKNNSFEPIDNPKSTGLSPDLTDDDIRLLIESVENERNV